MSETYNCPMFTDMSMDMGSSTFIRNTFLLKFRRVLSMYPDISVYMGPSHQAGMASLMVKQNRETVAKTVFFMLKLGFFAIRTVVFPLKPRLCWQKIGLFGKNCAFADIDFSLYTLGMSLYIVTCRFILVIPCSLTC